MAVLGITASNSPAPSPSTSVLGLSLTKQNLPVTGFNYLPFLLLAAMCYLFAAVALSVSSKKPLSLQATAAAVELAIRGRTHREDLLPANLIELRRRMSGRPSKSEDTE